jgi:hypothetical protein
MFFFVDGHKGQYKRCEELENRDTLHQHNSEICICDSGNSPARSLDDSGWIGQAQSVGMSMRWLVNESFEPDSDQMPASVLIVSVLSLRLCSAAIVMLRPGARVRPEGRPGMLPVGEAFLGRAVDGKACQSMAACRSMPVVCTAARGS